MNTTEIPLFVSLGKEAHNLASQLAVEQSTLQKGKQVYLNTLAVYAVHTYLKWLEIETDLSYREILQSSLASAFDAKQLVIPDIGKLECHPILPEQTNLTLYPEINQDLIGFVAIKLDEYLNKAELLGFVPLLEVCKFPEKIAIANLQPLDNLLDWIPDIFDHVTVPNLNITPVNLSRWLDNVFDAGWLCVEDLLSFPADNLAFGTRSNHSSNNQGNSEEGSVSRGKIIDLGVKLANHPFALIVTLASANQDEEIDICLRVYPTSNQMYLPQNLQLRVLDETGNSCVEMSAREEENWMRLEFTGKLGERFQIKLTLGDTSITEEFII
ncbi:MAG: DUF1822 family protein [Rivularia sp. (in: cyanobacteria)]